MKSISSSAKLLLELQDELKEYLQDNELFRCKDLCKDNIMVHSKRIHQIVQRQEVFYKKYKKIFNKIFKRKKKVLDIEIDEEIAKLVMEVIEVNKNFIDKTSNIKKSINFSTSQKLQSNILSSPQKFIKRQKLSILSESTGEFRKDIDKLLSLPEFVPKKVSFNRSIVPSNAHIQFIAKIEDLVYEPKKVTGTLINQSTVFQNGVPVSASQDPNSPEGEDSKEKPMEADEVNKTQNLFFSND